MEKVTAYCLVSGCTPEVFDIISARQWYRGTYGPVLTQALRDLTDEHELFSQNDLSVIGPMHPSGEPFPDGLDDDSIDGIQSYPEISPKRDVRVLPHCAMGELWDTGTIQGPHPYDVDWRYPISYGNLLMVQTHTLDIMALATDGRMTPLRLWEFAMTGELCGAHPYRLKSVDYGEIDGGCDPIPEPFPGLKEAELRELEDLGDVELVKQRLVHEGKHWIWMGPDRFPVSPTPYDPPAPSLPEALLNERPCALEKLPSEILITVISGLTLSSLVNLASASRFLHTNIFGNDYLAYAWLCTSAPWWIPAPTRTPRIVITMTPQTTPILPYLASQPYPFAQKVERYPGAAGLDWTYVGRCARSGSMLNRQRIWKIVLDIECVADLAGV